MKTRNEIQHKMKCSTSMIRSYQLQATCYRLIFILLSITIGSCYSIESDCDDDGDFYWERTDGSFYVSDIAVANNGDIWAGGNDIYLSNNNGNKWIKKNSMHNYTIRNIVINPTNGSVFVYSSGVFPGVLNRSTNNGEKWEAKFGWRGVNDIFITRSGRIYIANNFEICYSSDNGDNWIGQRNGLPNNAAYNSIVGGTDGTLYAGVYGNGVYHSTNGGDIWLPPTDYNDVITFSLTITDDGSIFAATDGAGVLKSTDRGITWAQINTGLPIDYSRYQVSEIIYNSITRDILVSAFDYSPLISYSFVYRSTNLGASWELKNDGFPTDAFPNVLVFNPNTGQMFASCDNGVIYRSKKK